MHALTWMNAKREKPDLRVSTVWFPSYGIPEEANPPWYKMGRWLPEAREQERGMPAKGRERTFLECWNTLS